MQKRIRTSIVLSLGLLFVSAGADPAGFSGRWKINLVKSSFEEIYPETYPETVLEIKLDRSNLSIRKTSVARNGDGVDEKRYTTDGRECLNAGEGIKDLKSVCRLENGQLVISGELEGALASVSAGGSEPASVEYFRYLCEEEYTLSADGKVLTIVQKLDFPNGKKTITLVFERA